MLFSASGVSNFAGDIIFIAAFALLTVFIIITAVWLITKNVHKAKECEFKAGGLNVLQVLLIIIAGGVMLRFFFAFMIKGYREDFRLISNAINHAAVNGTSGYYKSGGALYPLTFLVYSLMSMFVSLFNVETSSIFMQFFVKLPLIACDAVTMYFIYRIAAKYVNKYLGVILAGLFAVCPVFIMPSAIWGSVYSILILGLVLTVYFMLNRNFLGLMLAYGLSMLVIKDAIYLFPLIAVFVLYHWIKSFISISKNKPADFNTMFADKDMRLSLLIPVYFIGTNLAMYLLGLPSIAKDLNANYFVMMDKFFIQPIVNLKYFGFNSLGIFNIFGKNINELGVNFPSTVFAVIFGIIILAVVLLVYLSKKNRANMVLIAGYIMMTLATYFIDFNALSLLPILALFLVAFIAVKDKRIMQIFGLLAVIVFINSATVLANAGYLNNLGDSFFSADNSDYTGSVMLNSGAGLITNIVLSVLTVLTHIYATIVVLDVSMSGKRKLFGEYQKVTYFRSFINWMK